MVVHTQTNTTTHTGYQRGQRPIILATYSPSEVHTKTQTVMHTQTLSLSLSNTNTHTHHHTQPPQTDNTINTHTETHARTALENDEYPYTGSMISTHHLMCRGQTGRSWRSHLCLLTAP